MGPMCYNEIGLSGEIMNKHIMIIASILLGACSTLPTSSEYVTRAHGYLKDGKKQAAINAFNKAVSLNADNLDAYEGRGAAYFYNGQYELAMADFDKVLTQDPYRVPTYTAYASVLAAQGRFNDALYVLNLVDKLQAGRAETYFSRAGVYFMLGRYDLAVADYTRVLQMRPSADVFNARGAAYLKWGKNELAQKDFQTAKSDSIPQHLNDYASME